MGIFVKVNSMDAEYWELGTRWEYRNGKLIIAYTAEDGSAEMVAEYPEGCWLRVSRYTPSKGRP